MLCSVEVNHEAAMQFLSPSFFLRGALFAIPLYTAKQSPVCCVIIHNTEYFCSSLYHDELSNVVRKKNITEANCAVRWMCECVYVESGCCVTTLLQTDTVHFRLLPQGRYINSDKSGKRICKHINFHWQRRRDDGAIHGWKNPHSWTMSISWSWTSTTYTEHTYTQPNNPTTQHRSWRRRHRQPPPTTTTARATMPGPKNTWSQ